MRSHVNSRFCANHKPARSICRTAALSTPHRGGHLPGTLFLRVLIAAVVSLYAPVSRASEEGVTTLSFDSHGCNLCHFGGMEPPVHLDGPTLVEPGSTNEYTLEIDAVGNQKEAGLNVSAPAGMLTVGGSDSANTKALAGNGNRNEITQSAAKDAVNGTVVFTFLWTAPLSGSTVLTAWGNAVNGNFKRSGDLAASADLTVSVNGSEPSPTSTPTSTPTPGGSVCAGDCDGNGEVTVNEIILLVNIDLGAADAPACPEGIPDGVSVDITSIIRAVNIALTECPG